jgi:hypothetical protein
LKSEWGRRGARNKGSRLASPVVVSTGKIYMSWNFWSQSSCDRLLRAAIVILQVGVLVQRWLSVERGNRSIDNVGIRCKDEMRGLGCEEL